MVNIGLQLTVNRIVSSVKDIKLIFLALLANFVIYLLLVYVIVYFVPVSEAQRTAFIILSMAAGAPFLPKLAEIARSDIAYSIGIMVLLMIATIFLMPLLLPLMLPSVQVDSTGIAKSLILLMLLPLLLALGFRNRLEKAADVLYMPTKKITDISLLILTLALVALNYKTLLT